jgi:glucokinase
VFDAAQKGDKIAKEIFEFTGQLLGEAFVDFIAFCSPEAIILFGGLAHAGELLFDPIRKTVDANVMPIFKGKTKLLMSELKDADAAVLGASALGWELKDLEA